MQMTLCSRCGKNPAVVFITKYENNETKNEGLCLKCARELHIKPIDDVLEKMGISDEELEGLSGDMMTALSGVEDMIETGDGEDGEEDDEGKTATFPFFGKLFNGLRGGLNGQNAGPAPEKQPPQPEEPARETTRPAAEGRRPGKRKFLDTY